MAKPRVTKNPGETITQRPNMVRCRFELENGQLLSVFFRRRRCSPKTGLGSIAFVWDVAVYIGKGRKDANRWFHSWTRKPILQTGECGLEGLAVAGRYIRSFADNFIKWRNEFQIGWADDKRMRAYRWLLRYPGFALYTDENGKGQCIAYRNPEYYTWIPNKSTGPGDSNG